VIVTVCEELTESVVIVKVADDEPAATVTLNGTVAAPEFELDRLTMSPFCPGRPLRVTVPVAVA
jgi:hypothetical protein